MEELGDVADIDDEVLVWLSLLIVGIAAVVVVVVIVAMTAEEVTVVLVTGATEVPEALLSESEGKAQDSVPWQQSSG
jgi:hypothetical protein